MPVNPDEFRQALGHFAAAVTVITAKHNDALQGITATAFSSLSLDPPLVLVCIDKRAKMHGLLGEAGVFAVNILAEAGEVLSRRFASSQGNQFESVGYTLGQTGAPLLTDALTTLECKLTEQLPGGDHTIFVGQVEVVHVREGKPLVYFRGGYAQLA